MSRSKRFLAILLLCLTLVPMLPAQAARSTSSQGSTARRTDAQGGQGNPVIPFVNLQVRNPQSNQEVALSVQLLLLLSVLSLAPSIILMCTAFLRVSIVMDFVKRALSLQSVPPTQVLMGISLFISLFIMWPTVNTIYKDAYVPFTEGKIGIEQAYQGFEGPIRIFMYKQLKNDPESIRLFMRMSGLPKPKALADVPTYVLVPSFIIHELTVALKIGILIYIPFIIIDMVISSILMSMGMIMLPPVMISMPFKLILFVLVDGWSLLTQQLVASFN